MPFCAVTCSSTIPSSRPSTSRALVYRNVCYFSSVEKPSSQQAFEQSLLRCLGASWSFQLKQQLLLGASSEDLSTVITFSSQPVSWDARRTFWPLRPIALCARLSASTAMSIECVSSSTMIDATSAGAIALITNCAGLMSQARYRYAHRQGR